MLVLFDFLSHSGCDINDFFFPGFPLSHTVMLVMMGDCLLYLELFLSIMLGGSGDHLNLYFSWQPHCSELACGYWPTFA